MKFNEYLIEGKNWKRVEQECKDYVNHLKSGDRIPDNNGIYEAAMEATFGKNIWNELKKYW